MDNRNQTLAIATSWRQQFSGGQYAGGVVVIYQGEVQGWLNELRTPQSWAPGCIAVDAQCNQWQAVGGNAYDGAAGWEAVQEEGTEVSETRTPADSRRSDQMSAGRAFDGAQNAGLHSEDERREIQRKIKLSDQKIRLGNQKLRLGNQKLVRLYLEMSERYLDAHHPQHQETVQEWNVSEVLIAAMKRYVAKANTLKSSTSADWLAHLAESDELAHLKQLDGTQEKRISMKSDMDAGNSQ